MSIRYHNDDEATPVFRDEVPLPPSRKGPSTTKPAENTAPSPPIQGPPDTADLFAKAMDQAISEGKGWKDGEREVSSRDGFY